LDSLGELLKSLEIKQGDQTFTCRVWVLNAIAALEAGGFIRLQIPQIELEARATKFGDECMSDIQSGRLDIAAKGTSAIPVLDLRK
jgi:hypothetical protein